jgi:hypothetical protein
MQCSRWQWLQLREVCKVAMQTIVEHIQME